MYQEKMQEYWLKYETGSVRHCDEKLFLNYVIPQVGKLWTTAQKRQKLVMEMHRKFYW